jgi:predicted transcriptional regulator
MTQIKVPPEIKREIGLLAGITGRTQTELVAEAWSEYRARHSAEFRRGLEWAEDLLSEPEEVAVVASGLDRDQLARIDAAFADTRDSETGSADATAAQTAAASQTTGPSKA